MYKTYIYIYVHRNYTYTIDTNDKTNSSTESTWHVYSNVFFSSLQIPTSLVVGGGCALLWRVEPQNRKQVPAVAGAVSTN